MQHQVFISHATAEADRADEICGRLEADGIRCWIAKRDCPPGADWVEGIPGAIRRADLVLFLLSPEAQLSPWVDREVRWALRTERPTLPVLLGDTSLSERLEFLIGTYQTSRIQQPPSAEQLSELVDDVRTLLEDRRRAESLVSHVDEEGAPRVEDPFELRVTSARPAYFILLVDQSASMNRRIHGKGELRLRESVAGVVNDLLHQLLRASRRPEGYRNYFDVSVFGYGSGSDAQNVTSLLPDGVDRVSSGELLEKTIRVDEIEEVQQLEDGTTTTVLVKRPIWVDPTPGHGRTVMAAAFRRASDLADAWIAEHRDSLPPVILNISDGRWIDENPMHAVRSLQERVTSLGPALVFNCQLVPDVSGPADELVFPSSPPQGVDSRTTQLYFFSSVLPQSMRAEARARGIDVNEDSRGLLYNAPAGRLVDFIQVGTRTNI